MNGFNLPRQKVGVAFAGTPSKVPVHRQAPLGCAPSGDSRFRRDPASVIAMHRNFDVLRDPVFWTAMAGGIVPIAVAGAVLVWTAH